MIVTGAVGLTGGGAASAASNAGVGSSYAQGLQVTPHEGSLAVGAVFDEALAGHTDQIAKAQSQGLDLGAVGTSIKGYNCGQPPSKLAAYVPTPLIAETPDGGGTDTASAGPSPQQNNSDGSVEQVLANGAPYGEANTTLAGPLDVANNFIGVSGIASRAWSGLVNGSRDAGATADIGKITIAGVVALSNLHWEADYPANGKPTSSFSIGQATINGTPVPTGDPSKVLDAANTALTNIGVVLGYPNQTFAPPTQYNPSGIAFESPLQIEVEGGSARDQVGNPLVNAIHQQEAAPAYALENGFGDPGTQSPYNSLAPVEQNDPTTPLESNNSGYYGLQWALCNSDTPITVADVTMASFTSGGYFNIALGGVNASSGPLPENQYNLSLPDFGALSPGSSMFSPGTPGTPAIPATAGLPGTSGQLGSGSTPGSTTQSRQQEEPAASVTEAAAGPLLGIGLGVLGLLGLLAEADRRVIRRAHNTANFEE